MRGLVNRGGSLRVRGNVLSYVAISPPALGSSRPLSGDAPRAAMGVPAFFKWLSTKYGKIIVDCLEERHTWSDARARVRVRG